MKWNLFLARILAVVLVLFPLGEGGASGGVDT